MKLSQLLPAVLLGAQISLAQAAPAPGPIRLTKITRSLISSPQFSYTGAQQYQTNQQDRWLEVEVEFSATAPFVAEATFKYNILINGQLLVGEVTHVNISAGKELRSVMYVPPRALEHVMAGRALAINSVQNIAVQVSVNGATVDDLSLAPARAQWYAALKSVPNFVLDKNQTPFMPLYWDRYAQIKPAGGR